MARRPPLPQALAELIDELEPELAEAFLDAMADVRDGVDMEALERALRANDIEAAIRALNIEAASFNQYVLARQAAFAAAGTLQSAYIPTIEAASIAFRFDMSNPRAEQWIREQAAQRVAGYTAEQIEIARNTIVQGYSRGDGPAQIALDIAGRIDRVTGRRAGGIIGLSEPQSRYVESMRARLLSGDPREMQKVLSGQTLRDKRYDARILKAITEGRPVSREDVDLMTQRYADRLLRRRAEDISRTETAQAVMGARAESYQQAMEKEGLPAEALTKRWRHQGAEKNARVQHIEMNNKTVVGLNTPFIMPDGTAMQHSHDPAGGPSHNISCRCDTLFEIDFAWNLS